MDWYYSENNERRGPVSEAELNELVTTGRVGAATLVWREGWQDWTPLGEAGVKAAGGSAAAARCVECGNNFPTSEMVQYEGSWVCPNCKALFFQKIKEGVEAKGAMVYGGFWIRFVAKLIDAIILGFAGYLLRLPFASAMRNSQTAMLGLLGAQSVAFLLQISYSTFLVGKYGATLGKMACGLRVVTAAGGKVSYGLACGRFFAEILSGLILCIGYIMVAFDEEKRGLHDRICGTRVIRSNA